MKKIRIITGGQSGVDVAALRAAYLAGIATGGYAAKFWQTEDGPNPVLAEFGLTEWPVPGYPARTEANVDLADAVLLIGKLDSPGSKLVLGLCRKKGKMLRSFEFPSVSRVADVIRTMLPEGGALMVCGNRESVSPGITVAVMEILRDAFTLLAAEGAA